MDHDFILSYSSIRQCIYLVRLTILTRRNWTQRSVVYASPKIDRDEHEDGHDKMRRAALSNYWVRFDTIIAKNCDWKLIVLMVEKVFRVK